MEWFVLINVALIFFSWKLAQECEQWSFGWWANMFASAINAAAVLVVLTK